MMLRSARTQWRRLCRNVLTILHHQLTADPPSPDQPDIWHGLENLEPRILMSVSLDAAGWTVVDPSTDTRTVYVSSSEGDNSNTGLTPDDPVRTLRKGKSLVRNNSADWLLLKRGDVWRESFGQWTKSGRSADDPVVIGAYGPGDERPWIQSGDDHGLSVHGPNPVNNLAIMGLHFTPQEYEGPGYINGIRWISPGRNILFEDLYIERYTLNIRIDLPEGAVGENFTLRRSIVADAFSTDTFAQGVFVKNISSMLIEGNLLDHNGWNESVSGAEPTKFHHNIYGTRSPDALTVRGNILARASSHGVTARGAVVENNLFVGNSIAGYLTAGSVVQDNVILHASDKDVFSERGGRAGPGGWGLDLAGRSTATDNIAAHTPDGTRPLAGASALDNVVWNWGGRFDTGPFSAPDRTLASYGSSLGLAADADAFLAAARGQSRLTWNEALTAEAANQYIADGFTINAAGQSTSPPASIKTAPARLIVSKADALTGLLPTAPAPLVKVVAPTVKSDPAPKVEMTLLDRDALIHQIQDLSEANRLKVRKLDRWTTAELVERLSELQADVLAG